jgi:phosphatidylglycerol:prolipoprotein diacylglycerol transferase
VHPIPTSFHLGPLQIHTYGIGLAITFWVAYRYFEHRLAKRGFATEWVSSLFLWVIASAIVGARALHVVSNLGYYSAHPAEIPAIWQGGLSSFGGLLFAVPVAIVIARRRCPELGVLEGLDIVAPVLMAAWALGRLLGPQLMVAGGGHPTSQWFGMYYDGQEGKRVPVPLIQALEDFLTYLILLWVDRRVSERHARHPSLPNPSGMVVATGMIIWGITRALDEHYLLGDIGQTGSVLVQIAGVALVVGGIAILLRVRRLRRSDASPPLGDEASA